MSYQFSNHKDLFLHSNQIFNIIIFPSALHLYSVLREDNANIFWQQYVLHFTFLEVIYLLLVTQNI